MPRDFVLSLTGPDRVGVVDEITRVLLDHGGNVETSRMARLGGEFAVLMLVSRLADDHDALNRDLEGLVARGYKLTITPTERAPAETLRPGWTAYRIEVRGADHDGIVHRVAHLLSAHGINIEAVETDTSTGPFGGVPLFDMTARVVVPPGLAEPSWREGLDAIAHALNLEIQVAPADARTAPRGAGR